MNENQKETKSIIKAIGRVFRSGKCQQPEGIPAMLEVKDEVTDPIPVTEEHPEEGETSEREGVEGQFNSNPNLIDEDELLFLGKQEYNRLVSYLLSVDYKLDYKITEEGLSIEGCRLEKIANYLLNSAQYKLDDKICFLKVREFIDYYLQVMILMSSDNNFFIKDYFSEVKCHEVTESSICDYLKQNGERILICEDLVRFLLFHNNYGIICGASCFDMLINFRIYPAVFCSDGEFSYLDTNRFVKEYGSTRIGSGLRYYDFKEICGKLIPDKNYEHILQSSNYFCSALGIEDMSEGFRECYESFFAPISPEDLPPEPDEECEHFFQLEYDSKVKKYTDTALQTFSDSVDAIMGKWLKTLASKIPSYVCIYGKNIHDEVKARETIVKKLYDEGLLKRSYCTAYQFEQFLRDNPGVRRMVVCADTILYRLERSNTGKVPVSVRQHISYFPPSCFPLRKYVDDEGEYFFMEELYYVCNCRKPFSYILDLI